MATELPLPGLERLLDVCRKHEFSVESSPPGRSIPAAGALVAGHPFDPILATLYRRMGGLHISGSDGEFLLHRFDDQVDGLTLATGARRRGAQEPFHSSVAFGCIPDLAYYYAVVPSLADERGLQPVIYINAYSERYVLPVASDVDRFLDTLSRYLEILVEDEGYRLDGMRGVDFPTGVPELIARDRRLVEMLGAGRFDFIMNLGDEYQGWLSRVKSA
ncbi:hypothetical protein [Archangium lansingense]|uniref:SUKH-4 immunity protein of toxin-antitoxin system n=1 Tax=Archangium lansingense TaxID=2995310 RepID=A0ABT3ZWR4_9BACT|nr:hypothetical protein [Archangium lansinium]MCY1073844.1 hypothetical protein [Archangium lansinium]